MKKINTLRIVLLLSLILSVVCGAAPAQEQPATRDAAVKRQSPPPPSNNNRFADKAANLLQLLNLTTDQLQQIRAINQETREDLRSAVNNQRAARRALDAAIYADQPPDSTQIKEKARELGEAQMEAVKIRADVEFRIRQILTPEQLIHFRDLRRQFEQKLRDQLLLRKKQIPQ